MMVGWSRVVRLRGVRWRYKKVEQSRVDADCVTKKESASTQGINRPFISIINPVHSLTSPPHSYLISPHLTAPNVEHYWSMASG